MYELVVCKDCNHLRDKTENPGLCYIRKRRMSVDKDRACEDFSTESVADLFQ